MNRPIFHDGDKVSVGGMDVERDDRDWLVPPDKSCLGKTVFVTDEVQKP